MKGFITAIVLLLVSIDCKAQLSISFDTAYGGEHRHYKIFAVLNIHNSSRDTAFINKGIEEVSLFTSNNLNDTMVRDREINAIMYVNKERFPNGDDKLLPIERVTLQQYVGVGLQELDFFKRNRKLEANDFEFIIKPGRSVTIYTVLESDMGNYDKGFIKSLVNENVEISYWFRIKCRWGSRAKPQQKWIYCADPGHFSRAYFEQLSALD